MNETESKFHLHELDESISTRLLMPEKPIAILLLAHGAGAGISHQFMKEMQQELAKVEVASLSFNFLYLELGKRVPYKPIKPMKTIQEVWNHVLSTYELPMYMAGKSYGGRVGSMTINNLKDAKGLIFLGYPFHPPGKLEKAKDRTEHLKKISLPMLFLQGERDNFSKTEIANEFIQLHDRSTIVWLKDGDHSWKTRKKSGVSQADHIVQASKLIKEFCIKNN